MRITVIGAGPGGFAYASVLTMRGHDVTLCEFPEYRANIEPIVRTGLVHVSGCLEGHVALRRVTDDLPAAIADAEIIVVVTHAAAHSTIARTAATCMKPGQSLLFSPGYVGGALEFRFAIARSDSPGGHSLAASIDLAETQVLPFACRKAGPDHVRIGALKKGFLAASARRGLPSRALDLVAELFEGVTVCDSLLETGLNETNFIVHAAIALANLGFVEGPDEWRFYRDGLGPRVGKLIDRLDEERMLVGTALGLKLKTLPEWFLAFYGDQGIRGADTYELLSGFPPFADSPGPRSFRHRYFSEDIPYGLVPLAGLGRYAGVTTKLVDSLIGTGSAICGVDFMATGRNPDWAALLAPSDGGFPGGLRDD
jgi:opine dehydrogenase